MCTEINNISIYLTLSKYIVLEGASKRKSNKDT